MTGQLPSRGPKRPSSSSSTSGRCRSKALKHYGYHTSAFGKWHNTPATETTAIGPKDRWPNGYGFEYFYGFLAGETSQYEPRLVENYDAVEPPHDPRYHLTEDMVDKALAWIDNRQAFAPNKPFLMYWAPGAAHGPHHIFPEWADRYKGRFDDGWDAYRERVFKRQLEMGIIPAGTKLTPRDATLQAWADIPESQRAFQRRGMELFAGFVEHTDVQVGRLVDGLEKRGLRENTLMGLGHRRVGALQAPGGLFAGEQPRRRPSRNTRRVEKSISRSGRGQQGVPDRCGQLGPAAPRGPDQDALHELDLRCQQAAHARVHGSRARPRKQHRRARHRGRRGGLVDWQRNGTFLKEEGYYTTLIGNEAVKLIEAHDVKKPFFLYLASLAPHAPYQVPKAYLDRYASIADMQRRAYAAMISALDDQIGRIVAALEKRKLRDTTLIIFSSDNGGALSGLFASGSKSKAKRESEAGGIAQSAKAPASNAPFRGGKGSLYEGGVRVPTIFNWPGKLQPAVVQEPMHMVDVMPTLLALAGGKGDPGRPFDGRDIWATVAEGKPSPHEDILVNVEAFRGAIRKGDWKLVKVALLPGKTELFNLAADPGEKRNAADQNPEILRDLDSRLLGYAQEQKPSEWMKAQPAFVGEQGKTVFDPDFDITDGGLPREKPVLPKSAK
jgi:arylsulfatase A-like enzyme